MSWNRNYGQLLTGGIVLAVALAGCAAAPTVDAQRAPTVGADAASVVNAEPASVGPCAEFPPGVAAEGRDYEGWWSSSPADESSAILQDPEDWPQQMRDHLRTALVDVQTAEVLSTYDRVSCSRIEDFSPAPASDWPETGVVVLDADTGEVLEHLEG
ncbi:hypothetical protein [Cellulomonas sp. KRMCY2]|uniref:hypothetical protein n=1 Tax=Cellulomonas sp. KRMCY2 TaxID=1304865 RepID=UPI0012DBFA84|nr:hypothetical protein [Cellulomonas sp. KRMCY2]